MKTESQNQKHKEKKIYAREFHAIRDNGSILAYDVENIRLVQLNELELSVLDRLNGKSTSISGLKKRFSWENGKKVEETVNELIDVDMLGYSPFNKMSEQDIKEFERKRFESLIKKDFMQIVLNVTHKCNLNCDYCYGGDGSYNGPAIHMSRDTAKQAVDFLMKVSGNSDNCRITLFGGEPLLNFDLVKYVVQYARKEASKLNKKLHLGMTTNGLLLDDDKADFLLKENIEVTFSFDGPKKIQDKNRPFKSNKEKSSFDLIYPKILKYIEKAEKNNRFYAFRATITRPGVRNMFDVSNFFKRFKTKEIHYDTAEYKNGISPGGLAITDRDIRFYRHEVKKMADEFKKDHSKIEYDLFSGPLKAMKGKIKKESFCVSPGAFYAGVSAEGDIFPCHRLVGYKETKLGNVWDGFDREKWLKKYARVHIFNSKVCSRCWVRYFCGGMCPATNYFLGGDLVLSEKVDQEPVHCKLRKIVFEEAMLLFASLSEDNFQPNTQKKG
jgi:uncharacterized protein